MANVTYQAFLPEVMPHVQGAPELQVINAIRDAAIEFFDRSWVDIHQSAPLALIANTQAYQLTSVDPNFAIAKVLYGVYNNMEIHPITRADAFRDYPLWLTQTGTRPCRFIGRGDYTVLLLPIPSVASVPVGNVNALFFYIAQKPTRAQTAGVPDWSFERYLEVISHGAISRMQMITGQPWSNGNAALAHKKLFDDGIAVARVESSKSFTRAALRNRAHGVARW